MCNDNSKFFDLALSLYSVSTMVLKMLIHFKDFSYIEFLDKNYIRYLIWRQTYVPVCSIWKDSYFETNSCIH